MLQQGVGLGKCLLKVSGSLDQLKFVLAEFQIDRNLYIFDFENNFETARVHANECILLEEELVLSFLQRKHFQF